MGPAKAGLLLLLFSCLGLQAVVHGSNMTALATVGHTRHLQSSCDTGSFPELKPVSTAAAARACVHAS